MKFPLRKNRGRKRTTAWRGLQVIHSPDPGPSLVSAWNKIVDAHPGSDVAQLSTWARIREGYGYEPLYVFIFDGDALLGGAQVLHRRLPLIGEIGYVPHGPVVAAAAQFRPHVLEATSHALADLARRRFRMLFVQPPRNAPEVTDHLTTLGFRASSADLAPAGSVRIDLTTGEDQLHRRLSRSMRRRVGRWKEWGVHVRHGDDRDVPVLADLLASTAVHQGFEPLDEDYVHHLYTGLAAAGRACLFVGEIDGQPVAADLVTMCGDTLSNRLGGMDRSEDVRGFAVPAAIQWEIIKWAKRNGYRWYDLGGISETPLRTLVDGTPGNENSWEGADRFKLQFGGTAYRYPTPVEMIRPRPIRHTYDISRRLPGGRNLIRQVTQRLRGGRTSRTRKTARHGPLTRSA